MNENEKPDLKQLIYNDFEQRTPNQKYAKIQRKWAEKMDEFFDSLDEEKQKEFTEIDNLHSDMQIEQEFELMDFIISLFLSILR